MASPSFQGRGFQLANTALVSSRAADLHQSATQQHTEAISILKDEDNRQVFTWLDVVRSIEPGLQYCPDQACLTRHQFHALAALRHCNDNDIHEWLDRARAVGASRAPTSSALPHAPGGALGQGHTALPAFPDASRPGSIQRSSDDEHNQETSEQGPLTQPFPTIPPPATPKYCCTLCDQLKPFKNKSDWKKHERGHDTNYICMLKGPREATPQGAKCAFCGILDPHEDHLDEHNAPACGPKAYPAKRRYQMVNHLRSTHGILSTREAEAIAEKWKYTVRKQAWSCCFCVHPFSSFDERLNHIATEHYERGQTFGERDATNVIHGLLQQPRMINAWKEKLESLSLGGIPDVTWERDAVKELQRDLEVGPSDQTAAAVLADAAYNKCLMTWSIEGQRPRAVAESEVARADDTTLFPSSPFPAPTSSESMFDANHNQPLSAIPGSTEVYPNDRTSQDNPPDYQVYSSDFDYIWTYDDHPEPLSASFPYQT